MKNTFICLASLCLFVSACTPPSSQTPSATDEDETPATDAASENPAPTETPSQHEPLVCQANTFGEACAPCDCVNGTCSDGRDGSGACACASGFAGERCDACAAGFTGPQCDACAAGFTGPRCDACAPDHYGASCEPCLCGAGLCSEGRNGTGACLFDFQRARFALGRVGLGPEPPKPLGLDRFANQPWGSVARVGESLFAPDCYANRVLVYASNQSTSGVPADFVLGQTTATYGSPGIGAAGFNCPETIRENNGRLFITDWGNSRIVVYENAPTGPKDADYVIGQSGITGASATCSASGLASPEDLTFAGGKLIVADSGNNRILIYNSPPLTSGQAADIVIGQSDFVHCREDDDRA